MTVRNRNLPKMLAAALATAVLAGIGSAAAPAPAEAKKIIIVKGHHHHHILHRRYIGPTLLVASVGGGCYWLKERALLTGRVYWWDRYYACRGY